MCSYTTQCIMILYNILSVANTIYVKSFEAEMFSRFCR